MRAWLKLHWPELLLVGFAVFPLAAMFVGEVLLPQLRRKIHGDPAQLTPEEQAEVDAFVEEQMEKLRASPDL